jgi:putative hemolysin
MKQLLYKWSGLETVMGIVHAHPEQDSFEFIKRINERFNIRSKIHGLDSKKFKSTVFVSTHHSGVRDVLAVYSDLAKAAPGLKILVNGPVLKLIPMRPALIPANSISSKKKNDEARKVMTDHLKNGGNLLVFPSGKVAKKTNDVISDMEWRLGMANIIKEHADFAVPVYVDAKNADYFYVVRKIFPKLSMLFLLRTLIDNKDDVINAYFGEPIEAQSFKGQNPIEIMKHLRFETYKLKQSGEIK